MTQSKTMSFVEALVNTLIGLAMAFAVNAVLMYWTGVTASALQNFIIVAGHTVVSIVRGYVVRRVFNRLQPLALQLWWFKVRRVWWPKLGEFADKCCEAQIKYRSGRRF